MTGASLNPKAKVTLKIKAVTLRKSFKFRYFCPRFFFHKVFNIINNSTNKLTSSLKTEFNAALFEI